MCELLGMECNVPTDIVFSFTALSMRGRMGQCSDGWELALYEQRFARLFLKPVPACDSPLARFVRDKPIRTLLTWRTYAIGQSAHRRSKIRIPSSVSSGDVTGSSPTAGRCPR
jgi:hypothetical protein